MVNLRRMNMRRRWVAATLWGLAVAISPAWAGGVYLYEKSATDVGLGSAGWTARADDASTIFSNPAGLTRLEGFMSSSFIFSSCLAREVA